MSFISYEFLVLLAFVFVAVWSLPHRIANLVLLAASYIFYGWWDWRFLLLLLTSSVIDFQCGRLLDGKVAEHRRKNVLLVSAVANLGTLGLFKYFDFFSESFNEILVWFNCDPRAPILKLVLPVGISFYTFQTLSYSIDVYRRKIAATSNFADFLLYVSFFPQLVAGPIERADRLLPQISSPRGFNWQRIVAGLQLMLVGFFKKMVIADNLAIVVDRTFNSDSTNGLEICLATYAFAFQIYCDFSGYTDIARGVARSLGFELCLNFNLPYFASNPTDFWRRWHISLSTWIRDYLYIPLGGNRSGTVWQVRNLAITMLLAGLWHGASWHFVIWGLYHAGLLIGYRVVFGWRSKGQGERDQVGKKSTVRNLAGHFLAVCFFFQLTCIGWLVFRAESVSQLFQYFTSLCEFGSWKVSALEVDLAYRLSLLALPLLLFQVYQALRKDLEPWVSWSPITRMCFYVALFYGIVLLGAPERNEFIYFQF
ncbi:MBOAT family protein [Stieleria sp. JC731]|uniref:MBOAT family O-acyltransferase n=1 Tax=Pirellulaceae TaxID=2691357 RepID=UPI001E52A8FC|nr:MBOAT family protein [Stieleria sp. JC731]MCC9599423.1 MBOAT family protein [Stieleria sp. JC731]